jgi:FKBP-type peptidyl-prolyl cis-trans isomerase 2
VVQTPLGPGKVKDVGSQYDILIEAKPGDLKRMGPLLGRVTFADDRDMELDFSKKFGGEEFHCEVTAAIVKPVGDQAPAPAAAATPPSDAVGTKADAVPAEPPKKSAPTPEEVERGVKLLNKALAEAAKEGKTSVSIDADALLAPVAKGDLVTVRFTAKEPEGAPISLPEGMAKQDTPQEIIAGNEEVFPGLGAAVIGMGDGEKKQITLTPEKAFGARTPANRETFPLQNSVPAHTTMSAENYVKRFGAFPAKDKEVPLTRYMKGRVEKIGDKDVTLAFSAKEGEIFNEPFGTVTMSVGKDNIIMKIAPKLGAHFSTGDRQGVITEIDGTSFTVDFNHPLAGKTIVVDLEVLAVTRAADLKAVPINWIENHDAGLAKAKKEGKPLFLLLYADWCHWCQKTQSETLTDPRIGRLRDKFVWMRLNSDKEQKYKQEFGQDGFPMMVILRPDGTVLKKIDGYRDAAALKAELDGVI